MTRSSVFSAVGLIALVATSAHADPTKRECIDANAQGQTLQKDRKLRAAQSALTLCSSAACPAAVREDCAQRLDELERVMPSVVFEAKDVSGKEFTAVRVKMDGEALTDKLDGKALAVDPGEHVFTFSVVGRPVVTRTLVVRDGERARQERIVIPTPVDTTPNEPETTPTPTTLAPPIQTATPEESSGLGGQKIAGLVIGSFGIVSVGLGAVLGGLASSLWSSAQVCVSPTAPACTNRPQAMSDHDSAITMATVSDVAFIAGGALLATGLVVFLTAPKHTTMTTASVRVVPTFGPGSGGAMIVGSFQ